MGRTKRREWPWQISPGARSTRCCRRITKFPYTVRVVSEITESNGSSVDGLGVRRLAGAGWMRAFR